MIGITPSASKTLRISSTCDASNDAIIHKGCLERYSRNPLAATCKITSGNSGGVLITSHFGIGHAHKIKDKISAEDKNFLRKLIS